MADDLNWFRKYYEFPGTGIVLYEANSPQSEIVLLSEWYIRPGATKASAQWDPDLKRSVNVHAGEEVEEYEEEQGVPGVPAKQKRTPKIDGLGADEPPRRRTVTGPSTIVQGNVIDPTKPLPKGATAAERLAWEKAVTELWEKKIAAEEKAGVAVRGWRMRALSAQKERELFGHSSNTAAIVSALFKLIPKDQKTWLQSGRLPFDDPYRFGQTKKNEPAIYTPWVRPECVGWLVAEGAKRGVYFATKPTLNENITKEIDRLRLDVQNYLDGKTKCSTNVPRVMGVRLAARVLKIGELQPLSASALDLFNWYQAALRESDDKHEVHEAYHRILLHRFLRRRSLVPSVRSSRISKEAERRANLLQAHRIFVFNQNGCPTRLNENALKANGIDIQALGTKNPTLIYMRNPQNQYLVNEWTRWFIVDILGKDPAECRTVFSRESLRGLFALAGLGFLG